MDELWNVLPGLPGEGPVPEQFSATGQGKHREGLVVRFNASEPWVGNFQPGLTSCFVVVSAPEPRSVIVVSGGQAYMIDPERRLLLKTFGGQIADVIPVADPRILLFSNGIWLEAVTEQGTLWRSRRLSWDGFRNLRVAGPVAEGEAWCPDDTWHSFRVDLYTGDATGGSYSGPDSPER